MASTESESPAKRMRLRPSVPSTSLRKPANRTDKPPKSGKSALPLAACAFVMPTACVKYIGVQRLNVSRSNVVPSERTQTSQNAEELRRVRKIEIGPG